MADYLWLSQFTRKTWNPYGFGFACAYSNGKPTPIDANPAGLAHSTETPAGSVPSYGGGKENPNFTVDPWVKRRYQHVPANIAARAMVSNNSAVVQVEIIGYCDKATAQKYGVMGSYLPNLDADGRAYLAESLKIIGDALGIPATTSVKWLPYPASYGNNGIRLTNSTIRTVKGWVGHQHAPAPDNHGDPGDWFPAVLALMAAKTGTDTGKVQAKPLALDGSLGPLTVAAWQRYYGSTPDGVISDPSALISKVQDDLNRIYGITPPLASGRLDWLTEAALMRHYGATTRAGWVKVLQGQLNKAGK